MKWAMRDSARFLHEYAELERLAGEAEWLSTAWRVGSDCTIEVDIDLIVHKHIYKARLSYPDIFPNSPPYIRPRDQSERWTNHQYGAGGSLCLQWRADNWQPHVTGADLVRSAFELLSTERHPEQPGAVLSAHRVTEGQSMRSEKHRFVATPGLLAALAILPLQSSSILKTHTLLHKSATVAFISEVTIPNSSVQTIKDLPSGIASYFPLFAWKGEGWAFRSDAIPTGVRIVSVDDLLCILEGAKFAIDTVLEKEEGSNKYKERLILLLGADVSSIRIFSIIAGEQPVLHEYTPILPPTQAARLPPEHEQLAAVRFGIVGLGSIGSKITVSLARSGARRFLLVDDDYLAPGNICRNELSWGSAGVHKVNAVSDALSLISGEIDVDIRVHRVAGQESAMAAAAALKDLAACDVLIDATANPEVFLRLAAVAKLNRRALCWGELFAGGCGGLIARARPDLDPNPLAVRSAIYTYFDTLSPAPFKQVGGYDVEQEQPLIAYDSDVGQIATLLTRFALDTALQRNPSQFPYPAYVIGMRREWDFDQPFDTRPIRADGDGWDDVAVPSTNTDRDTTIKMLLDILGTQLAESSPTS